MDISTLKRLRTLIPGFLIIFELIPALMYLDINIFSDQSISTILTSTTALALPFVIGYIYNAFCIRSIFNNSSYARINENIKNRIFSIGRTTPITDIQQQSIKSSRVLLDIFYAIVDTNESLKERSKLVRNNGLAWSSTADCVVIGSCFSLIHLPIWITTDYSLFLYACIFSLTTALICAFIIHPQTEKRQIELGNEQLNFIQTQLSDIVKQKVNAL